MQNAKSFTSSTVGDLRGGATTYTNLGAVESEILNINNRITDLIGGATQYTNLGTVESEITTMYNYINSEIDALEGNASLEYNTLGKIEALIKALDSKTNESNTEIEEAQQALQQEIESINQLNTQIQTDIDSIYGEDGRDKKYNSFAKVSGELSDMSLKILNIRTANTKYEKRIASLENKVAVILEHLDLVIEEN